MGPLGIRRSYSSGLVTNFPTTVAGVDVNQRVSLFSFKTDWSTMAARHYDKMRATWSNPFRPAI